MGCDIHTYVEIKKNHVWQYYPDFEPFDFRSYGVFGFLADVRNYSHAPVISKSRGLPSDISSEINEIATDWFDNAHNYSFLFVNELIDYDYDQIFWDRRITKRESSGIWNGAALATNEDTEGQHLSLKNFLGSQFFEDIEILKSIGDPQHVRVIFWFDN